MPYCLVWVGKSTKRTRRFSPFVAKTWTYVACKWKGEDIVGWGHNILWEDATLRMYEKEVITFETVCEALDFIDKFPRAFMGPWEIKIAPHVEKR